MDSCDLPWLAYILILGHGFCLAVYCYYQVQGIRIQRSSGKTIFYWALVHLDQRHVHGGTRGNSRGVQSLELPGCWSACAPGKIFHKCTHNCSAELESYITINIYHRAHLDEWHRAHLDEWQSMRGRGWKRFDSFIKGSISVLIKNNNNNNASP